LKPPLGASAAGGLGGRGLVGGVLVDRGECGVHGGLAAARTHHVVVGRTELAQQRVAAVFGGLVLLELGLPLRHTLLRLDHRLLGLRLDLVHDAHDVTSSRW
jgi:hypothetical protein